MFKFFTLIGPVETPFERPEASKFYALIATCAVLAPVAIAALAQGAQGVA